MIEQVFEMVLGKRFSEKQLLQIVTEAISIKKTVDQKMWKRAVRNLSKQITLNKVTNMSQEEEMGVTIVNIYASYRDELYSGKGSSKCNYTAGDAWNPTLGKQIAVNRAKRAIARQLIKSDSSLLLEFGDAKPSMLIMGKTISPHPMELIDLMLSAESVQAEMPSLGLAEAMSYVIAKNSQEPESDLTGDNKENIDIQTKFWNSPFTH